VTGIVGALARAAGAPLRVVDSPEPLDAIVVLGAPLRPDGGLSDVLAERVAGGLAAWRAGGAPIVCVTGGDTGAGHNEADAMAAALIASGLPREAVRVERTARTTAENATRVAALLAPERVRRVWLVTQPFHGRRARRVFRAAGLEVRVWHIEDSLQYAQPRRALRWITREYAAWIRALVR